MSNFLLFADASETVSLISAIVLGVVFVFGLVLCFTNKQKPQTTKSIAYGAICVAGSFVLSFVKIPLGGYGGSVTLASMLPLFIYCYVFGIGKGLLVGIVYGLLQLVQEPWILNAWQVLLDYVIAFAFICLSSVFKKVLPKNASIFTGAGLFSLLRFLSHFASGFIVVEAWKVPSLPLFGATDAMGHALYSFLYNAIYMVPETIILFIALGVLVGTKQFNTLENMMLKAKVENN
jgi:thiamine transporter